MIAFIAVALIAQGAQDPNLIPTFSGLAAKYEYKHLVPGDAADVSTSDMGAAGVTTTFTFIGTPGDIVHATLVEPKSSKPVPVVLLLHGLGGNAAQMEQQFGKALLADGIAYAAIDAPGHGTRTTDPDKTVMAGIGAAFVANKGDLLLSIATHDPDHKILKFLDRAVQDGVKDNRRLLDYLMSRPDVDYRRVSLIGVSMGSIIGSILGSVDNRVKSMLLEVGGDPTEPLISSVPPDLRDSAIATSCSLYAHHFAGMVRMLNGSKDTIMPKAATDRLYAAFPDDKKTISWYDSDHFLPPLSTEEAVQWVNDRLN